MQLLFAVTLFVSAFLLFLVQPLVADHHREFGKLLGLSGGARREDHAGPAADGGLQRQMQHFWSHLIEIIQ